MSKSITINFKSAGCSTYLNDVSDLIIGNMVEPGTNNFWSNIPPGGGPASSSWTWEDDGSNENAFGLMGNYKYQGTETTALSMIVIDPTKFPSGDNTVEVTLYTAEIGPGNNILKFREALVNGSSQADAAYPDTYPGEPAASFYDC